MREWRESERTKGRNREIWRGMQKGPQGGGGKEEIYRGGKE